MANGSKVVVKIVTNGSIDEALLHHLCSGHPNVVKLLDMLTLPYYCVLVLPALGCDLRTFLENGRKDMGVHDIRSLCYQWLGLFSKHVCLCVRVVLVNNHALVRKSPALLLQNICGPSLMFHVSL